MRFFSVARLAALGFSALGLAGASGAQVVQKGNTYTFRAKFTKNAVAKYNMVSTLQGMKVTGPLTQTVISVIRGVANVRYKVGPFSVNGGQPISQPEVITVQLDSLGNTVGSGRNPTMGLRLSEKPLRVGDSYTTDSVVPGAMPGLDTVRAKYTFRGLKTLSGKQVAEIDVLFVPGKNQPSGSGKLYLLAKDCSLYSMNVNMKLKGTPQNGKPATETPMTIKINRT